jgi:hypothetical protein
MRTPYPGQPPYTIPGWIVPIVERTIVQHDLWDNLTPGLQTALNDAVAQRAPLEITTDALDKLPDDVWNKLAAMIPAGVLT